MALNTGMRADIELGEKILGIFRYSGIFGSYGGFGRSGRMGFQIRIFQLVFSEKRMLLINLKPQELQQFPVPKQPFLKELFEINLDTKDWENLHKISIENTDYGVGAITQDMLNAFRSPGPIAHTSLAPGAEVYETYVIDYSSIETIRIHSDPPTSNCWNKYDQLKIKAPCILEDCFTSVFIKNNLSVPQLLGGIISDDNASHLIIQRNSVESIKDLIKKTPLAQLMKTEI
jgi:hypothetical protein